MWIHAGIFAVIIVLCMGVRMKKIHLSALEDAHGRRLFVMAAVAGNLLGIALTWQKGRPETYGAEDYLIRLEENSYEEIFEAEIQGEKVRISVMVPQKETESTSPPEEAEETQEQGIRRRLEEEIAVLNEERADEERYYLPQSVDGKAIVWVKPGSTDGAFLAALFLTAGLAAAVFRENEKLKAEEKRRDQLLLDYPGLVMKLTLLVQAGMTVRSAFRKTAADYEKRKKEGHERYAYEEMITACHEMDSGISEGEAYERFAARCNQVKYKTLANLLVQNLQKGSQRLLEMLETESIEAFEDRKRKARVLGEAAATKLLVPMLMMLLIVLAIVMIPAVLSFW
ncbi:MAG: type II secretion system F family protein [Eubacteriales bacterium]|nr:type II secretion system F family protein [Eubacteriales bacterium]